MAIDGARGNKFAASAGERIRARALAANLFRGNISASEIVQGEQISGRTKFAVTPVSQEIWTLGNLVAASKFPRKSGRPASKFPRKFGRS